MSMLTQAIGSSVICPSGVICGPSSVQGSSFDTCKIIMSNRNQVLRFDIATSTNYPSCINLECQACCFVCSPHTNIVNEFVCQATFAYYFRPSDIHDVRFHRISKVSRPSASPRFALLKRRYNGVLSGLIANAEVLVSSVVCTLTLLHPEYHPLHQL